jgi:hypothetical protein
MKMHSKEFQILVPIGRQRSVRPDVFEVADGMEDSGACRRHLIGIQTLLSEQLKYGAGRDRG